MRAFDYQTLCLVSIYRICIRIWSVATLRFPRRDVSCFDVSWFLVAIVCATSSRLYVFLVATLHLPRGEDSLFDVHMFSRGDGLFYLVATLRSPRRSFTLSFCVLVFLVAVVCGGCLCSRVSRRDNHTLSDVCRSDCSCSLSCISSRVLILFDDTNASTLKSSNVDERSNITKHISSRCRATSILLVKQNAGIHPASHPAACAWPASGNPSAIQRRIHASSWAALTRNRNAQRLRAHGHAPSTCTCTHKRAARARNE